MPRPRVVEEEEEEGGVVEPVPGGLVVVAAEGEAPIITTLVKGTAMEGEQVATPTLPPVVGVAMVVPVVGEGPTEHHNRVMGKLMK